MIYCGEYKCIECGHDFGPMPGAGEGLHCPRCGSGQIEHNPYLFGSPNAEDLTPEDYFSVLLKP